MKQMIILIIVLMILLTYHGDTIGTFLHTPVYHFDFIHIIALVVITRLVWWR